MRNNPFPLYLSDTVLDQRLFSIKSNGGTINDELESIRNRAVIA
jgi:hypothetical protein